MNELVIQNNSTDLNYLCHYGVPRQEWGKHDPSRRWQRHAVYANGQSDPNAKERGALSKLVQKPADKLKAKMASLVDEKKLKVLAGAVKAGIDSYGASKYKYKLDRAMAKLEAKEARRNAKEERKRREKEEKKSQGQVNPTKELSTDQLKEATARLRAENDYMDAYLKRRGLDEKYKESLGRPAENNAKKIFDKLKSLHGSNVGILAENTALYALQQQIKKSYGDDAANKLFRGTRIGDKKKGHNN